jgi:uncharacterized Zn ribbon protein
MPICRECKKEYVCLQENDGVCPACKYKAKKSSEVQDRHLQEKQKRFTSE